MRENTTDSESYRPQTASRRAVLRSLAAGSAVLSGVGLAGARENGDGFPPKGITTYGGAVTLGEGTVRPFTSETPSGEPNYHGVEFERAALKRLPSKAELNADRTAASPTYDDKYSAAGEALEIHTKESLEFFVEFPDAAKTPFTFLGLNWNPEGHSGAGGAWTAEHFDIHFHMLDTATIDAIEGPDFAPYDDIPAERMPAGYGRSPEFAASERYITDMGEHVAPGDAPEVPGNPDAFANTLIQGFVEVNAAPQLAFVEPMITREFLQSAGGTERYDVPQPAVYPHEKRHPTQYSVRDIPANDSVAVVLEAFEQV